ncbi:MAG: hypothetical protein PHR06_03210 [Candidatus Cloacimonetes bacterium]|nr:hypothetical protein [Candidatus Cloacimonadota bacterium]
MKKTVVIFSLLLVCFLHALVIQSTAEGGYWNDSDTWMGGSIPAANDDVVINGSVWPATESFCQNLTITGDGVLLHGSDSQLSGKLTVQGNLSNNGSIHSWAVSGNLEVVVCGDVYINGNVDNDLFILNGLNHQMFDCETTTFHPDEFKDTCASSDILLMTDLTLNGVDVDLGSSTLILNYNGVRHITLTSSTLENAVIVGGDGSSISNPVSTADTYLENVTADELVLSGRLKIRTSSTFGYLINQAVLTSPMYAVADLYITDRLDNYGTIDDGGDGALNIHLGGHFYNYAYFYPNQLNLVAPGPHNLWQAEGGTSIYGTSINSSVEAGDCRLVSNISFARAFINLGGNDLLMYDDRSGFGLYFNEGYLKNATIDAVSASYITMNGGDCYIEGINANCMTFKGSLQVRGATSSNIASVINIGTIGGPMYAATSLSISQRLENYGSINNAGGGSFTVYVQGDLYNYGSMNNFTKINGTLNQFVRNAGSIHGSRFILTSELGASQWYFNGSLFHSGYLIDYGVNPASQGVWQPFDGTSYGRQITIGDLAAPNTPAQISLEMVNGNQILKWSQVTGAACYKVYSSTDPSTGFTVHTTPVYDSDPDDGWVYLQITPTSDQKRFFRVVVLN